MDKKCSIFGCNRSLQSRGWCHTHYERWRRNGKKGDPSIQRTNQGIGVENRFWMKVKKTDSCWLWIGSKAEDGYGHFRDERSKMRPAHRWLYEHLNGEINKGLHLDHLCRTPSCVRPDHLEVVTPRINQIRGIGFPGVNYRKTHCKWGHLFTKDSIYSYGNGHRICKACIYNRSKQYKARRKINAKA